MQCQTTLFVVVVARLNYPQSLLEGRGEVCLSVQREDTAVYSYTGCAQDRGPQENPYLFSTRSIHPLHTPAMRCQIKIPMVWTEGKEAQRKESIITPKGFPVTLYHADSLGLGEGAWLSGRDIQPS